MRWMCSLAVLAVCLEGEMHILTGLNSRLSPEGDIPKRMATPPHTHHFLPPCCVALFFFFVCLSCVVACALLTGTWHN